MNRVGCQAGGSPVIPASYKKGVAPVWRVSGSAAAVGALLQVYSWDYIYMLFGLLFTFTYCLGPRAPAILS
jgi:hypothetical protein